jgi:homocysteine S-methyltransferase
MDRNFFKNTKILDGGMGQELLARGLKPKGTLWSASALINKDYHQIIVDTHLDYIKSGAEVITTNSFCARRERLIENKCSETFEYANQMAGELAVRAKKISKENILIAGSLPSQKGTYIVDTRENKVIEKDFNDQAQLLKPFIDFFYLDVICSSKEIGIAMNILKKINLPILVGLHISKNGKLPSGESIAKTVQKHRDENWLGIILACVSPEIIENSINEINNLDIPFGYKANLWEIDPISADEIKKKNKSYSINEGANPNVVLGKRENYTPEIFYNFSKKMKSKGATILGGCCETNPSHIKEISRLK